MRISVVMSTFNGEKYLVEQMDSIRQQTRKADEVIISDDCSSDNTVKIIQEYIEKYNLANWKLITNKENKGFIKNFLYGAENASGDLLFFSDQDDIWTTNKIKIMEDCIIEKNAYAIYCMMDTIGADGNRKRNWIFRMNQIKEKSMVQKVSLCEKIKYGRSPGLCLALKKEILDEVRLIALEYKLPHDIPVGTVAAVKDGYYVINEVLVHHRIHENNASSPITSLFGSINSIERQIESRELKLRELNAVNDIYGKDYLSENEYKTLTRAIDLTEDIIYALKNKKASVLLKAVFSKNEMINRKLTVRNFLAVLYDKFNAKA